METKKIGFIYLISALISINLFIISLILYDGTPIPMIFALACFGASIGVVFRGFFDPDSWGKTLKRKKVSAYMGFISWFAILFIEYILLVTKSFKLIDKQNVYYMIYGGAGIIILYWLVYFLWFRKTYFK